MLESKIDEIKNYLKDLINLDADFKIFYGGEGIDEKELLNFFNTPSFFSEKKVTLIKDIDRLSPVQLKVVTGILSKIDTREFDTILIMTSSKEKLGKDLLEQIKKSGVIKNLVTPHTDSLKKWIEEKAELDGIRFTQDATTKLIENVNFDLSLLEKEYEKLYTFIIDQKVRVIDEKAVDKLVSRVYEMKIFDLVDLIGNREKNKVVKALKPVILEKQSIIGLVTLLFRMFKYMLYLKSTPLDLRAATFKDLQYTNPREHENAKKYIASHLGHAPFMLGRVSSNYTRFSKKYSAEEIIRIIGLLNSYDIILRSGIVSEYNLVLKMINEIIETKAF